MAPGNSRLAIAMSNVPVACVGGKNLAISAIGIAKSASQMKR
jgi:hypothetical protein